MGQRFGCCGVSWNTATILLLSSNILFNCSGVLFSLFYRDQHLKKYFFYDKVEQSMAYIFVLIEIVVFFSVILSAFKKKTSMLTFATVMLLLESFFITFAAVRIFHGTALKEFWEEYLKPQITHESLKEIFQIGEDSVPLALVILFCSILTLILVFKICTAMVVNSYKNHMEIVRTENMFFRFKTGREKPLSRPTSYVYSTMPISTDKNLYE